MDWNLIRVYLAVAEQGSTLAAAKHLDITQSTVSRRLSELEKQLSVQLFDRRKTGLVLTDKGVELLSIAQQMDTLAYSLESRASHFSSAVAGTVRISASEPVAVDILPGCLSGLLDDNPELQIEIIASNEASNLLSREADIAIRMFEPTQQELISTRLPDVALGFFAHSDYLDKFGRPKSLDDFAQHRIVGFDLSTMLIDFARQLGVKYKRERFQVRSDAIMVQNECVKNGVGIAVMQLRLAQEIDGLEQVHIGVDLPPLPLYLVAQQELRASRKLRLVYDALNSALTQFYA